jgi:hypothetical protein
LSFDATTAGYAFTGVSDPNVYALMSDYEQDDWNGGRSTDPSRPPWTFNYAKAFPLLRGWNFGFASTVAADPVGAGKKTGLAPQDAAGWNYGQIAQNIDKQNARLGARHLGPQSVQTQDACVGPALKQGVGAFFFFASDDSMRLLFQQPQINALRPAAATASGGTTGGVGSPH